jgi:hypothetical protein
MLALAVVCVASISLAQVSDQVAATRVLGQHWRQISRTAQIIFSGTVLSVEAQPVGKGRPLPLIVTKFRVDRAIANVKPGQVLTIREWVGAWDTHRAMTRSERLLLFFYAPSKLRLTSPVGGRLGQIALNPRGEIAAANHTGMHPLHEPERTSATAGGVNTAASTALLKSCPPDLPRCAFQPSRFASGPTADAGTSLDQLVRAIRQARRTPAAKNATRVEE